MKQYLIYPQKVITHLLIGLFIWLNICAVVTGTLNVVPLNTYWPAVRPFWGMMTLFTQNSEQVFLMRVHGYSNGQWTEVDMQDYIPRHYGDIQTFLHLHSFHQGKPYQQLADYLLANENRHGAGFETLVIELFNWPKSGNYYYEYFDHKTVTNIATAHVNRSNE